MFCLFALSKRICIEALIGNKIKEGGYALCTLYSLNVSASCSKESRNRIMEENCTLE